MRENYINGNYGYGHAKQALYEVVVREFTEAREKFTHYMENRGELDVILAQGARRAGTIANEVLGRVRNKLGYLNP